MGIKVGKYLSFCHSKRSSSSKKQYPTLMEELCPQFSLAELKESTNNFDEDQVTRISIFSKVYKGCLTYNGVTDYTVALKRLKSESMHWKFKKEIEFNCQLRHPNLVSLIGFCDHKEEKILVFEHMSNGSLYDCLISRDMEPLSWKKRLEICIGAAKGLHYLHTGTKHPIFHCDIKPQNICLDNNMIAKLSHLGFSLQGPLLKSQPKPIKVDNVIGTPAYMAPEYVLTKTFTDKCDVYSFGMVLLEVVSTNYIHTIFDKMYMLASSDLFLEEPLNLMHPFLDVSNFLDMISVDEIIDPILMKKIAPECLAAFIDITKRCLRIEPNERPDIGEVQVELEQALALQEEADVRESCSQWKDRNKMLEVFMHLTEKCLRDEPNEKLAMVEVETILHQALAQHDEANAKKVISILSTPIVSPQPHEPSNSMENRSNGCSEFIFSWL